MSKVLLVNPPFPSAFQGFPMGLLYLGAALEESGHVVRVFDYSDSVEEASTIADEVLAERPDVVGITSTSPSYVDALRLIRCLRERSNDVWLVKGGYHEKYGLSEHVAQDTEIEGRPSVDYVVSAASAESQIVSIANARDLGAPVPAQPGLHASRGPIGPYDERPAVLDSHRLIPARHLLTGLKRDYGRIFEDVPATQMMSFRGCRFRCSFCAVSNTEEGESLETVARDIAAIRSSGYGAVFLDDATFTVNWDRAEQVCELLRKSGLIWACQTRADQVSPDRLAVMAKSGCAYIYFGLESGSPRVLRAIQKGLRPDRVVEPIKSARRLGLKTVTSFIFGVPLGRPASQEVEDEQDWKASVDLIRLAGPNGVVPSVFAYYPGSPAWASLPPELQRGYSHGVNRTDDWRDFDDGFGAIHHVGADVAQRIARYLRSSIPEFLAGEG